MARSSLPAVTILDERNLTAFKSVDKALFIAYPAQGDTNLKRNFRALAERHQDKFSFGMIETVLNEIDGVSPDCVAFYREGIASKMLCGHSKLESLEHFLETATTPIVGELTRRNESKYLKVTCNNSCRE